MGNASWGHGYHKGFSDGAKQGGAIVGLVFLGASALVAAGKWGFEKLQQRKLAKADEIAADMDALDDEVATDPQGSN